MSGLTAHLDGADKVMRGLAAAPKIIKDEAEKALAPAIRPITAELATYPAERPGQRSRRTGRLGAGWQHSPEHFNTSASTFALRVTNPEAYATYVQGPRQVWFHKGRWTTVQEALDNHRETVVQAGETMIAHAVDRIAGGG